MRAKGQALIDKLNDCVYEMDRLIGITHNEEDYSILVKNMGGEIEKFLKSTIFPLHSSNASFFSLINNLLTIGLAQQYTDYLHDFRNSYNGYKHDPSFTKDIGDCQNIFKNALKSIENLVLLGVGNINQPYHIQSKRIVWFAGWDDYIGGMTEIGLFIPDYSADFPFGFEHFNIDLDGWDSVLGKFTATGELQMGKEFISDKAFNSWKREGDFLNAGKFNGDIAELIKEISSHINYKKESELLPSLKRESDYSSVKAAVVFSLFDTITTNTWGNFEDFLEEIMLRASYDYGINCDSIMLKQMVSNFNSEMIMTNKTSLEHCSDIVWTDAKGYEKNNNNIEISKELFIALDRNDRIITRIK